MGIRFYCPNGHRLNVKDFLAGKRGICPHCQARFRIPSESAIPERSPRIQPGSVAAIEAGMLLGSRRTKGAMVVAASLSDAPVFMAAPIETELAPSDLAPSELAPSELPASELAGSELAPSELAASELAASELAASELAASELAASELRDIAARQDVKVRDIIDEAPDAIWYVRPATGGQYGPAKGDVVRRWIVEGRVTADALVWREGWAEWQVAGPVFPGLGAAYTAAKGAASTSVAAPAKVLDQPSAVASSRRTGPRVVKKKSAGAIIVLALLIVVLCAGLVIALTMRT